MMPTATYYQVIVGGSSKLVEPTTQWMTLAEIEALGQWDYVNTGCLGFRGASAYSALMAVGCYGGYAEPSNGMDLRISEVDTATLLVEMANHGPTPNDGAAS